MYWKSVYYSYQARAWVFDYNCQLEHCVMYIKASSCRILNKKLKSVLYVSSVYISSHLPLTRLFQHYHYTKHTAPSTVKAVIDGGKYLRFSVFPFPS
jgi:hypothetical protein